MIKFDTLREFFEFEADREFHVYDASDGEPLKYPSCGADIAVAYSNMRGYSINGWTERVMDAVGYVGSEGIIYVVRPSEGHLPFARLHVEDEP